MTGFQYAAIIATATLGTMLTRFLPFIAFGGGKPAPKYVQYLGKALPGAALGLLVVYCVRNVNITVGNHGIPVFAAILVTAATYIFKRKMLLSIVLGTASYIVLLNLFK